MKNTAIQMANQITNHSAKHLTFITLLLLLCLSSTAQAATGTVALGDMQFTQAVGEGGNANHLDEYSIDGDYTNSLNQWIPDGSSEATIIWTWDAFTAPTLDPDERVIYTYTVKIHTGTDYHWTFSNYTLRNYSLALGDPDSSDFTVIKDYESVTNTLASSTISVNANGLIQTTEPSGVNNIDTHTLVFTSITLANQLRLIAPEETGGWGSYPFNEDIFTLNEIIGSIDADVVPEPSTYALILGLMVLGFVALKRRRK